MITINDPSNIIPYGVSKMKDTFVRKGGCES
jgi:hypothetical protein